MEITTIKSYADKIHSNIQTVIIGKSAQIDLVITALFANGHVLLEDVPGTGKTVLAKTLSKSVHTSFSRIQFTPDLLPSDVSGLNYYNQKESEFQFRKGPIFTNILLGDEINRATPRTQSSLLECMEERQVTIDGETHVLSKPFFVIATQNPVETAGTFPLPEAQLDRFMMQIHMGFPTVEEEIGILHRFINSNPLQEIESVCTMEELVEIQNSISNVYVHPVVMKYMAKLVEATRNTTEIILGVSPRGTLALLRASQSYAAIQGLSYVTPDIIKHLAVPVLSHRIVLQNSYNRSETARTIIHNILDQVPVPTEDFIKHPSNT